MTTLPTLSQRADLTFKHNMFRSRHGWFRLTPAYSVKLVNEILDSRPDALSVLDPFSGTATTTLAAVSNGHSAFSCDINPFLVWLGNTKLNHYSPKILQEIRDKGKCIEESVKHISPIQPPPISNIERWWDKNNLDYLCRIKAAIEYHEPRKSKVKDLLLVAFCRLIIELSNASFGHQSVSFKKKKNNSQKMLWEQDTTDSFIINVDFVTDTAKDNPIAKGKTILCDARTLNSKLLSSKFDLVITSPPYPNRMSYIRELRPYMYWLGYLKEAKEAGELDWDAIGGTWGIATSRLTEWGPQVETYYPDSLKKSLIQISQSNSKSGHILSNYVAKYFEDMWQHFNAIHKVLKPGAELHYIIGNSKFYEIMVHAENIYSEMMSKVGFQNIQIKTIRKRNSKKELFEFDVIGHY